MKQSTGSLGQLELARAELQCSARALLTGAGVTGYLRPAAYDRAPSFFVCYDLSMQFLRQTTTRPDLASPIVVARFKGERRGRSF
jgi:hypothetical protein